MTLFRSKSSVKSSVVLFSEIPDIHYMKCFMEKLESHMYPILH